MTRGVESFHVNPSRERLSDHSFCSVDIEAARFYIAKIVLENSTNTCETRNTRKKIR